MVLEGSENKDWLLGLCIQGPPFQNRIQDIILFIPNIYAFLLSPLLDLFIPSLCEGSVVIVEINRSYLMLFLNCLQHL